MSQTALPGLIRFFCHYFILSVDNKVQTWANIIKSKAEKSLELKDLFLFCSVKMGQKKKYLSGL